MSSWEICNQCRNRFLDDERRGNGPTRLCQVCKDSRRAVLMGIAADRHYRDHLARWALGIRSCEVKSLCAEQHDGANQDLLAQLPATIRWSEARRVYAELVDLAFAQMRRPWDDTTVTALEIVVTQAEPSIPVEYCNSCLGLALDGFPPAKTA